jgi:hypothetical protein
LQPEICQYLISHKADVDIRGYEYVDDDYGVGEWPILSFFGNDNEHTDEEVEIANECRKILLEAGADPLDETDYVDGGFFRCSPSATL